MVRDALSNGGVLGELTDPSATTTALVKQFRSDAQAGR